MFALLQVHDATGFQWHNCVLYSNTIPLAWLFRTGPKDRLHNLLCACNRKSGPLELIWWKNTPIFYASSVGPSCWISSAWPRTTRTSNTKEKCRYTKIWMDIIPLKILTSLSFGYSIHNYWPFLEFKYPLFPFKLKMIPWIVKKNRKFWERLITYFPLIRQEPHR
jgi:hypothetical protein